MLECPESLVRVSDLPSASLHLRYLRRWVLQVQVLLEFEGVGAALLGRVVNYVPDCLPLLGVLPADNHNIMCVPRPPCDLQLRLHRVDFEAR